MLSELSTHVVDLLADIERIKSAMALASCRPSCTDLMKGSFVVFAVAMRSAPEATMYSICARVQRNTCFRRCPRLRYGLSEKGDHTRALQCMACTRRSDHTGQVV